MRRGTLEVQAVARFHAVVFVSVQPDFELAAEDVKEFFAFILSKQGQQIVLDQAIFLPLQSWQAEASASLLR